MLKLTKKQVNAAVSAASMVLTRRVDEDLKTVLFVPYEGHLEARATNGIETVGIKIDAELEETISVPLNALTSYKTAKPDEDFYAYFDGNCVYCGPESDMAEYPAAESEAIKPSGIAISDFDVKTFLETVRSIAWAAPKKDPDVLFSNQSVYTVNKTIMAWGYVLGLPSDLPFGSIPLTQVLLKKMPTRGTGKIGYDPGNDTLYLEVGKFWHSVKHTPSAKTDVLESLNCVLGYENSMTFSDPQKQAQELREVLGAFPSGSPDHAALRVSEGACTLTLHLEGETVDLPLDTESCCRGEDVSVPVLSLTHLVDALDAGFARLSFGGVPSEPVVFEDGESACIILPIAPELYSPEDEFLAQGV